MRVDKYSLFARALPVLIVIAPVYLALFAIFSERIISPQGLGALAGIGLIAYLLGQVGRDQGKKLEPDLWQSWGGAPTTQLLRHHGTKNQTLLNLRHSRIERATQVKMPTAAEEMAGPEQADQSYEAAVSVLRNRTRDTKAFPLVFNENVSYGFRRNLVGMRPAGIVIAFVCTGLSLWFACSQQDAHSVNAWFATAASAILLALWLIRFRQAWVKPVAFAYAERLLEAAVNLEPNSK